MTGQYINDAVAYARVVGQTAAVSPVVSWAVGAADTSYLITGNVDVSAYTSGSFSLQVSYTNESGTAANATMQGHFTSGYGTTISGLGSFEVEPIEIRAQAGTTINLLTVGTFTNLTYNVEGRIYVL